MLAVNTVHIQVVPLGSMYKMAIQEAHCKKRNFLLCYWLDTKKINMHYKNEYEMSFNIN